MNTESPRLRALLAAGAALVVFGITIPATASPDAPNQNRPGVGDVGQAQYKANPKGQFKNDHNRGFTCDENKGAGIGGNPALPHDCGDGSNTETPPPSGTGDPTTGGGDTTTGGGETPPPGDGSGWSADNS